MNILTFDIEDWFHILDHTADYGVARWNNFECRVVSQTQKILTLLSEHNQKATFFVVGWIAERYPNLVKEISNAGHEIGTHSHYHQLAYNLNKVEYRTDLEKSIYTLEDLIGNKIISYRAPGFSIKKCNLWCFDIMQELGIINDCSVFPAHRSHGGIPDIKLSSPFLLQTDNSSLHEFPMSYVDVLSKRCVFTGGGYFRLTPLVILKRCLEAQRYNMLYLHPRDLDVDQPLIDGLSKFRKFKHYVGIKYTEQKLNSLLFNTFYTVSDAAKLTDWSVMPSLKLKSKNV